MDLEEPAPSIAQPVVAIAYESDASDASPPASPRDAEEEEEDNGGGARDAIERVESAASVPPPPPAHSAGGRHGRGSAAGGTAAATSGGLPYFNLTTEFVNDIMKFFPDHDRTVPVDARSTLIVQSLLHQLITNLARTVAPAAATAVAAQPRAKTPTPAPRARKTPPAPKTKKTVAAQPPQAELAQIVEPAPPTPAPIKKSAATTTTTFIGAALPVADAERGVVLLRPHVLAQLIRWLLDANAGNVLVSALGEYIAKEHRDNTLYQRLRAHAPSPFDEGRTETERFGVDLGKKALDVARAFFSLFIMPKRKRNKGAEPDPEDDEATRGAKPIFFYEAFYGLAEDVERVRTQFRDFQPEKFTWDLALHTVSHVRDVVAQRVRANATALLNNNNNNNNKKKKNKEKGPAKSAAFTVAFDESSDGAAGDDDDMEVDTAPAPTTTPLPPIETVDWPQSNTFSPLAFVAIVDSPTKPPEQKRFHNEHARNPELVAFMVEKADALYSMRRRQTFLEGRALLFAFYNRYMTTFTHLPEPTPSFAHVVLAMHHLVRAALVTPPAPATPYDYDAQLLAVWTNDDTM